jgi:hypothetical protein
MSSAPYPYYRWLLDQREYWRGTLCKGRAVQLWRCNQQLRRWLHRLGGLGAAW